MNSEKNRFWCANEVNPRTKVVEKGKWSDCTAGCPLTTLVSPPGGVNE